MPKTSQVTIYKMDIHFKGRHKLTCNDKHVIYMIDFRKYLVQYIGSTIQPFKLRSNAWRSDINLNLKVDKVIAHFNRNRHILTRDFKMIPIENVFGCENTLRMRERMYIDRFNLTTDGLNSNASFL